MSTPAPSNPYEVGLDRNDANTNVLTPLTFLKRTASVFPDKIAVVHGDVKRTYREVDQRVRRLGSALAKRGIGLGDTVAVLAPNIPEAFEAHFGVPATGGVLNALNIRLDAATIAFILGHGEAKILITDKDFSKTIKEALTQVSHDILVVDIDDPTASGERVGSMTYEELLAEGDPDWQWQDPKDEWQAITLNYTSGTTGNPKGVVYHHRGAHLNAIGNCVTWPLPLHPTYLWTLPMFHCNGWCFPWSITAMAGTHVCLRTLNAANIYNAIADHGVTHLCGAPIVMGMMVNAPDEEKKTFPQTVNMMTAGAAPPAAILAKMAAAGFNVTHVYGLTETYGPVTVCAWHEEWNGLDADRQATLKARQGVPYATLEGLMVANPSTLEPVRQDGETMGEIFMRGNTVMKGYLKNPKATEEAFAGGWFHTGDLGVWHADGYIEVKDRSKDIIISGGENISTIEVEDVLYKHPAVLEAAVVARPDEKWGETPCAFVTLKTGASATEAEIIAYCRENLAHFKAPKTVVFTELPKTSTGKIQKFQLRDQARAL